MSGIFRDSFGNVVGMLVRLHNPKPETLNLRLRSVFTLF
jgi:hypothetical protein